MPPRGPPPLPPLRFLGSSAWLGGTTLADELVADAMTDDDWLMVPLSNNLQFSEAFIDYETQDDKQLLS